MRDYPSKARVILWGIGALGSRVLREFARGIVDIEVAGVVDHDPRFSGKRLVDVFPETNLDLTVHADLPSCVAALSTPADVVYHMTESYVPAIQAQLEQAMSLGLNVISASEGMFHPALRFPDNARALDAAAQRHGVSLVGCGINPGFVFDTLILVLARVTASVRRVEVSRVVDVTGTGLHDIDHVGFGLPVKEFEEKLSVGRVVGHMGMPESIAAVAERLGLAVDRIEESWRTHFSDGPTESGSDLGIIPAGHVTGIAQHGVGYAADEPVITMKLMMFYEPERFGQRQTDEVVIEGSHRIHASLTPSAVSIQGAGLMIINATHDVVAAAPGLRNVLDFTMGGRRRAGFSLVVDPAREPQPRTTWLVRESSG